MAAPAVRTSLIEQKRIQWAREREELARLCGSHASLKSTSAVRTTIRTYPSDSRPTLTSMNDLPHQQQKYASAMSLRSLTSDASGSYSTSLCDLNFASASLSSLQDQAELERLSQRRSPSLPPIFTKDEYRNQAESTRSRQSRTSHRCPRVVGRSHQCRPELAERHHQRQKHRWRDSGAPEEREGETSGYASDTLDAATAAQQQQPRLAALPCHVTCDNPDSAMSGKAWRNPYHAEQDSLPAADKLDNLKAGEFNRQRWGSVWGQETSKDPPPPSWLERGLSRLDHNSQVLVINHDSASSSNSSTTGSLGSDTNKTYLRGQNLPIDADILHEREIKRQKALELQSVIKQQLEERERKRVEEREKRLEEERAEEERIHRETILERRRIEEEQQRQRDKEAIKLKKSKLMQESIESAERQAKEDKRLRRYHADSFNEQPVNSTPKKSSYIEQSSETPGQQGVGYTSDRVVDRDSKQKLNWRQNASTKDNFYNASPVRLPVSQEVAIVLSGRIEDPELLRDESPLKLVSLVVSPGGGGGLGSRGSGREGDWAGRNGGGGVSLSALLSGLGGPVLLQPAPSPPKGRSPGQRRLLTPSKYRLPSSSECATQTDCEAELSDEFVERMQETRIRDAKERKETANNTDREDIDKSTNTGSMEEYSMKNLGRNKPRTRMSIETRPRWNANRPGTRYRTQSEKDPHYQRRMRLRRRQVETSDEGSSDFRRSPSPHRRSYSIMKAKSRSSAKCKTKIDNYDADLSMDSLHSLIPLHVDKNGRINIEKHDETILNGENSVADAWGGNNILSHLNSLRNGLIMKKKEWDLQACPVSPITELY